MCIGTMDCGWIFSVITAFAAVITACAAVAAACAAIKGINAWRNQLVGRRKMELAEETLQTFHNARAAIAWARNPATFKGEVGIDDNGDRATIPTVPNN